jgi:hypothetical protein
MGLFFVSYRAFVFHASSITERVTGQKLKKYDIQMCRKKQGI